jgi:hypothetical protein
LIQNSEGKRDIHKSFKGKQCFVRFIWAVEKKFGICFSNKDWDTIRDLSKLTERLTILMKTPRSTLTVINNRPKEPFSYTAPIMVAVFSLLIALICFRVFG